MKITGKYNFEIKKVEEGYVVIGKTPNKKGTIITQGRNKEEVFDMISDAYLTVFDVKVSWWNKLLWKLIKYKKIKSSKNI